MITYLRSETDEYFECVLCIFNTQIIALRLSCKSFYSISCQFVGSKSQGVSNMCGWIDVFTCVCHWYTRQTVETDVVQTRLTTMVPDEWHVTYEAVWVINNSFCCAVIKGNCKN